MVNVPRRLAEIGSSISKKQDVVEINYDSFVAFYVEGRHLFNLPKLKSLLVFVNSWQNYLAFSFTLDHHYVSVSLRKQGKNLKKQRTSVIKHDPNPTFGKSLVFDVPKSEIEFCTLVIKVRHHGEINRDRTFAILRVGHNAQGSESSHWNDMIESGECVTRWHRMVRIEPADDR